jgi:hydrogenase nickel incorporation protein HypA/HybF
MHELSIAQSILEIVREYVPEQGSAEVQSVKVRLGNLSGVVPESLEFCFSALISDTPWREAKLNFEHVPTEVDCLECGKRSRIEEPLFLCPECNGNKIKLISGAQLQVVEIELTERCAEIP